MTSQSRLSKTRKEKLEKNIWKYYVYRVLCSFTFTWPIFVLFLQDLGLNATQILTLQAWYTLVILVLQIPAGIITDYIGTKKVMVFNSVIYVIAFIVYGMSKSFYHLMIAEAIFAVAVATWIASGQPLLYDTLRELKQEGRFKKVYGTARAVESLATASGAIIGGYIALHSLSTPFLVSAIPAFIGLLVAFTFTDPQRYVHGEKKYLSHLKDALKFTANHPKVRFFIVYAMIVGAVFWSVGFFTQPYYQLAGLPLGYFGWVYAVMLLGSALIARYAHETEAYLGERWTLALSVVIPAVCFFAISKTAALVAIALPIIANTVWQFQDIIIADYVHKHVESHQRATVISLQSTAVMIAMTATAPLAGLIADTYTLQSVYFVGGVVMMIALALLLVIFYAAHRKTKKPSILA